MIRNPDVGLGVVGMNLGVSQGQHAECLAKIPKALPMYVFSGTQDPVHSEQKDIERMLTKFSRAGLTKVELRWYEEGRHEMFNETNRQEVMSDLLAWIMNLPAIS